jgi:hypothetical protein
MHVRRRGCQISGVSARCRRLQPRPFRLPRVSVTADRRVRLRPKGRACAIWLRALGFVSGKGAVDRERRADTPVRRYRELSPALPGRGRFGPPRANRDDDAGGGAHFFTKVRLMVSQRAHEIGDEGQDFPTRCITMGLSPWPTRKG